MGLPRSMVGQYGPRLPIGRPFETVLSLERTARAWQLISRYRPACLLLAHPDRASRQLMCSMLRADGHRVVEAGDRDELLERLADELLSGRGPPDLIVTLVRQSGLVGLNLLAGLRRAGWPTPMILLTDGATPGQHARARRYGRAFIFTTPFDLDDLRTAVFFLLRRAEDGHVLGATSRPRVGRRDQGAWT